MPQPEFRSALEGRQTSLLNPTLDRHLSSYGFVAWFAGARVQALAGPAEAKVVLTETNQLLNPFQESPPTQQNFSLPGNLPLTDHAASPAAILGRLALGAFGLTLWRESEP